MQLKHLEVLHAVMTAGSFTAAARQLGLTQPSISKAVQRCEADLGLRLFDRRCDGIRPTPAAQCLARAVAQASQDLESVQRTAGAIGQRCGKQ
jgi:DNA-binding transcriptional LysR family regulator